MIGSTSQNAGTDVHVLHVVSMLGAAGGMEMVMSRLLHWMNDPSIWHSIAVLRGPAGCSRYFDETVRIFCLRGGRHDVRLPVRLARLIRRLKPNVINAWNWYAWPDTVLARLISRAKAPLVFSFHGYDFVGRMPLRRRLASRVLAGITDRIMTVSKASQRILAADIGVSAQRIDVIPNGVDTVAFSPVADDKMPKGRLVVGTVGSLKPIKNQSMLIRAVVGLVESGLYVELRIVGDGTDADRLTELVRSLRAEPFIHLLGLQDDIPAFLRGLNVFVLPSDTEAHPIALLEAMACGLPCVATRVGGVPEILREGEVGILIEPRDQTALEQALTELIEQPVLRSELGKAARVRVCERYSKEQMVDAYANMYRELSQIAECRHRK